jgi:Na+-driven multidrug efflux pump
MESGTFVKDLKVQVTNRQILSIAVPISLAILVPQINLLTNSIFLGNLSTVALGNAGITGVFYLIFAAAGHGFNNSVQSVLSGFAGADQSHRFKTVLTQGIRICLIFAAFGILFTWVAAPAIFRQVADPANYAEETGFLRIRILGLPFLYLFQMGNAFLVASLNSRLLIIGFFVEALVNVLFDYLLIFGHGGFQAHGFKGAAWASVIAEISGCLTVFIVLIVTGLKKEYVLLSDFGFDRKISNQILGVAIPLVLQFIVSVATWLVFFFLIESLNDPAAKAISNTMRNIFGLAGVFVWAFSGTSNTMVSNLIGQGKQDLVLNALKRITLWSFSLCAIMCLLVNSIPVYFFGLFGQGPEFVSIGVPVLRSVSAGLLVMSVGNIWLNGITGTGKTKINLVIEIVAIILYLLYTVYVVKINYRSLAMAWTNELVYWASILIVSVVYMHSRRWRTDK